MPAFDIYHDTVKRALIKDGWTITHDPYHLRWGLRDLYVDLGVEHLLAATQGARKIAVEIKSFVSPSVVADLENALGQYVLYHDIMARLEPERALYLAIRDTVFFEVFTEPIGQVLLDNRRRNLLVFQPTTEVIIQWIP